MAVMDEYVMVGAPSFGSARQEEVEGKAELGAWSSELEANRRGGALEASTVASSNGERTWRGIRKNGGGPGEREARVRGASRVGFK
jgi:hypothetical protein